jgi:hypothetical protein
MNNYQTNSYWNVPRMTPGSKLYQAPRGRDHNSDSRVNFLTRKIQNLEISIAEMKSFSNPRPSNNLSLGHPKKERIQCYRCYEEGSIAPSASSNVSKIRSPKFPTKETRTDGMKGSPAVSPPRISPKVKTMVDTSSVEVSDVTTRTSSDSKDKVIEDL